METRAFRRHALLPKAKRRSQATDMPLWPPLSDTDLLRHIVNCSDRLGSGHGTTYLLVSLPNEFAEQLEAAGVDTTDDEDTCDAEHDDSDAEPDADDEDSDDDSPDHLMTDADAAIRGFLRLKRKDPGAVDAINAETGEVMRGRFVPL